MSKDVQQAGASRTIEDQRTGLARQITVDESNWDLRVHDGETPGGHRVLNRDNNDSRYQIKNPELDGLVFADEAKGFLVRFGPGDYGLRTLTVSETSLTITYGDGQADNPGISLANIISTDHTFSGNVDFTGDNPIPFASGITGNVTGDLTGNVTGDVTGNVQGNTEGNHVGGVDARGADLFLDDNQIPMGAINGLAAAIAATAVHSGFVWIWSGSVAAIPAGWFLCDGSNGTPDLRSIFVLGAGGAHAVGDSGGVAGHGHTVTIDADGVHSHTATGGDFTLTTAEMPAHYHGSGVCDTSALAFNHGTIAAAPAAQDIQTNSGSGGVVEAKTTSAGTGNPHSHSVTVDDSGSHTHAASSDIANHMPPWYALCYVMKG